MKRIAIIVLCSLILCGLIPMAAFAENDDLKSEEQNAITEVVEQSVEPEEKTETNIEETAADEEMEEQPETEDESLPTGEEVIPEENKDEDMSEEAKETEEEELQVTTFAELIAEQGTSDMLIIDRDVLIDTDTVIGAENALFIENGTVTLAEGVCVENNGYINISGGELVLESAAKLENCGYIEVLEKGSISLDEDAGYVAEEGAVLHLDVSAEEAQAEIIGIDSAYIELTVYAANVAELSRKLANSAYAFVTVCIDDASMTEALGTLTLGENVSISLRH